MKTHQKLLLDDLIETVLHLNEKDSTFDATLKISSKGITLTTYANTWGMKTSLANSEEDLRDMIIWIKDQFRRSSKGVYNSIVTNVVASSAGQKIHKFGLYLEPNEEIRDLEDDLKRGIR
jgi:putative lipoic acid-binding regulatory protein